MDADDTCAYLHTLASGLSVDVGGVIRPALLGPGHTAVTPGDVTTDYVAETVAFQAPLHPDYSTLAGRYLVARLSAKVPPTFSGTMTGLGSMLLEDFLRVMREHVEVWDAAVAEACEKGVPNLDFFGVRTLTTAYLLKDDMGAPAETPAMLYMRVAIGIHLCRPIVDNILATFWGLVNQIISHATPTLFFAGTKSAALSSCYLTQIMDDSIEGIFKTMMDCAVISKRAGGIGVAVSNVRCRGSKITSTRGTSSGLVPMLKVMSQVAKYVDQGGGKRKGAIAVYLEPWHGDLLEFLDLRKTHGAEEARARDLFCALWVPDLFMRRVADKKPWTLMCPKECPGLMDVHGPEFDALYETYEARGLGKATLPAADLWLAIVTSIVETGGPFVLFKDACNRGSNQSNLGTIKCGNLCTEVIQYVSASQTAVCNLAAVILDSCVTMDADTKTPVFDFDALTAAVRMLVVNLNAVIDTGMDALPTPEARAANSQCRAIGIGVVGLADTFTKLDMPFDSVKARQLNHCIFETMYFAALSASCDIAMEQGRPYPTFPGSPLSRGQLQFDLNDSRHDWSALRARIMDHGVANSLLIALMPTASTAQIVGRQESFEPYFSMMYNRRVLAGDFIVVNRHLVHALEARGLWTPDMRTALIAARGSVQNIAGVPDKVKALFKTAFEISHRDIVDMAGDRQRFICQGQSLNVHMANATRQKVTAALVLAWQSGLKNGSYYFRGKPITNAAQLGIGAGTGAGAGSGVEAGVEVGPKSDMEHEIESRTRTLMEKDADEDDSTNKGEAAPFVACDMCSA
jgi:ribonucleoside-diphosphate reductase alpha subunit